MTNATNVSTSDQNTNDDGLDIPAALRRTETPKTSSPIKTLVSPAVANKAKLAEAVKAGKGKVTAKPAKAKTPKAAKPAKVEQEDGEEGDTPLKLSNSIVPTRFKQAYAEHQGTCGDKMALALKAATTTVNSDGRAALDLPKLKAIAAANHVDVKKYDGLNPGQWRMNIGNKLRGMLKNGEKVTVGKQVFANAEKALAKPEAKAA